MSKVSIIVPVYNVEKYLDKCLNSLVNQTLKDIEIIVVNDGSPDNSSKIIEKYKTKYSNIKVLNQDNQGLSDARNNALHLVKSDYIMYVDSDDYINEDMVEKMYSVSINEDSDVVICGNNVVDENYSILSSSFPNNRTYKNSIEKIIFGNMCVWNKLYKKDLIVKNKFKFRSRVWYEDIDFSFKVCTSAKKISFLDENLYNYLLRENSIMSSKNLERNLEILSTFEEIINYAKKKQIFKEYYNEIEFLNIDHIYISTITRILLSNSTQKKQKEIISKIINYINSNFPRYKNNIYIKKLSRNRKIIFYSIYFKQYWLVRLIFKIKRCCSK